MTAQPVWFSKGECEWLPGRPESYSSEELRAAAIEIALSCGDEFLEHKAQGLKDALAALVRDEFNDQLQFDAEYLDVTLAEDMAEACPPGWYIGFKANDITGPYGFWQR